MVDAKIRDIKYALDNLAELVAEAHDAGFEFNGLHGFYVSGLESDGVTHKTSLSMVLKIEREDTGEDGVKTVKNYTLESRELCTRKVDK